MQAKKQKKVAATSPIGEIVALNDVKRIKDAIAKKYGFLVSDQYCLDLIQFVEEMTA